MDKASMSDHMSWPEGDNPATPDDEYELRRAIDELRDRKFSVGSAYRRVAILPDFVVLWQIGMRKTAIGMLVGWIVFLAVVVALTVTQRPELIGLFFVVFIVMVIASWVVFLSLEEWTEDYNRDIDDQIRQLMGRKRH